MDHLPSYETKTKGCAYGNLFSILSVLFTLRQSSVCQRACVKSHPICLSNKVSASNFCGTKAFCVKRPPPVSRSNFGFLPNDLFKSAYVSRFISTYILNELNIRLRPMCDLHGFWSNVSQGPFNNYMDPLPPSCPRG